MHGCDAGIVEGIIADGQSLCPAVAEVQFAEHPVCKRIASDRRDRAGDGDLFKIVIAVEYVVRDDFNAVAHRIIGRFALINEQGFVGVLTVRALQINRVAVGGKGRVALFHGNIDVFIQAEQEAGGYDRIFRYGQRREPAPREYAVAEVAGAFHREGNFKFFAVVTAHAVFKRIIADARNACRDSHFADGKSAERIIADGRDAAVFRKGQRLDAVASVERIIAHGAAG